MLNIRLMTKADVAYPIRLTDELKWGYFERDFERMIEFDLEGMFIAEKDNIPIGFVASSFYQDYSFIGPVIVEEQYRSEGLGETLMRKAMDHLTEFGTKTIELDSVWPAAPLYRRLGFKDKYFSYRVRKQVEMTGASPKIFSPDMLDELLHFDKAMTGINREKHLRKFAEEFADSIYIIKQPNLRAYALVRERQGDLYWIGPMVAENLDLAEKLFYQILAKYTGKTIGLGILETNRGFIDIIRELDFIHTVPALRMYLGEYRAYEDNVYAIIAAEKG